MACPWRGVGVELPSTWVQFWPSYSHVSPSSTPAWLKPPNKTVRARAVSKVIEVHCRAGGDWAVLIWVHRVSSHSQVSPRFSMNAVLPPKTTAVARMGSYAIACRNRGFGPATITLHVEPSHSQVELVAPPPFQPPKNTVRLRPLS